MDGYVLYYFLFFIKVLLVSATLSVSVQQIIDSDLGFFFYLSFYLSFYLNKFSKEGLCS